MTPTELEQLKEFVALTITTTVNGKIDRMNTKLDTYIKEDNLWKEKAQPIIDLGNNARGASVVALWLAGFIAAIGGAYLIIKNVFKK